MGPPEFPAVTEVPPFKCSNPPCVPQKQPPASTADSWPFAAAKGSSMAGFGKGIRGVAGGGGGEEGTRGARRGSTKQEREKQRPLKRGCKLSVGSLSVLVYL